MENPLRIANGRRTDRFQFVSDHSSIDHTSIRCSRICRRVDSCYLNQRLEQHNKNVVRIALEVPNSNNSTQRERNARLSSLFLRKMNSREKNTNK